MCRLFVQVIDYPSCSISQVMELEFEVDSDYTLSSDGRLLLYQVVPDPDTTCIVDVCASKDSMVVFQVPSSSGRIDLAFIKWACPNLRPVQFAAILQEEDGSLGSLMLVKVQGAVGTRIVCDVWQVHSSVDDDIVQVWALAWSMDGKYLLARLDSQPEAAGTGSLVMDSQQQHACLLLHNLHQGRFAPDSRRQVQSLLYAYTLCRPTSSLHLSGWLASLLAQFSHSEARSAKDGAACFLSIQLT